MPKSVPPLDGMAIFPDLAATDVLPFLADSVICTDQNGCILFFSPAAERSFGYSAAEIIGKDIGVLIPPRYRTNHLDHLKGFASGLGDASRLMGREREVWSLRKNGDEFIGEATISRNVLNGRTILTVVHRDITDRKDLDEQRKIVIHELNHRIKNVISVVSALVSLTATGATSVLEFRNSLQRRLNSLAATQAFLTQETGSSADLQELLSIELASFGITGENLRITGPTVSIRPTAVQPLALVIHELATNSAKYGAFSTSGGVVTIILEATASESEQFTMEWRESGGPPVSPPDGHGFGTQLIQQLIGKVFHGLVFFDFRPEGLICRITIPLASLTESNSEKHAKP